MKKIVLTAIIPAVLFFSGSSTVFASLYDIVCVECSLTSATYEFNNQTNGNIATGNLTVTGGDFGIDSFFDFPIHAHDINFYWGSGTYTFDSIGDTVTPAQDISMTLNPGQVGVHFLFDWTTDTYNNTNIDVLNVFNVSYINGDMILTSTDVDGDGIIGFAMVDGPFQGVNMATGFVVATPIPAAAWLFGSGLLGLIGFARRKQ